MMLVLATHGRPFGSYRQTSPLLAGVGPVFPRYTQISYCASIVLHTALLCAFAPV